MPSETRRLLVVVLATLGARLLVFPFNEHLYGDAVSRTEMAAAWARSPHLITSFGDGAAQYGPLHLYLIGAALGFFDPADASRLVSLIFGVLTVIPVFALTRHYFAGPSALWAGLAFACWGLHLQASTTGGSEAVALFLMWVAFAWFARALYRAHWLPFAIAALALNLAAATRYDAWMYVPLLAVVPFLQWRDRAAAARYSLLFVVLCLPFPMFWLVGNYLAHGDAFYPFAYIDAFHRSWAAETPAGWPSWWLRAQGLGFWPAMAVVTLSPGVAILGAIGMVSAWRMRPAARWLVVAAVVPTLYYAFRTAVLIDFVPLGRFTVVQLSLLLPFVTTGWAWVLSQYGAGTARRVAYGAAALAMAVPTGLAVFTAYNDSTAATVMKPVSPVATNPVWVMRAADLIRTTVVEPGRRLGLDEDSTYQDMQVGFFTDLDGERTIRLRHVGLDRFLAAVTTSPPDAIVTFRRGRLLMQPSVTLRDGRLTIAGHAWIERQAPEPLASHIRVFDRDPQIDGAQPAR